MDEKRNGTCDESKRSVSKDWLKPASVSLHKLDQVCTNIYNLGLADSKQLKATNRHAIKSEQAVCNEEGSKPPLPEPSIKQISRAWGSSTSIPDLIKKQIQRQRFRPESAKISRQMRPPSGKKTRPQSAKEIVSKKLENGLMTHETAVPGIKGEHCDPSERPDGASVYLAGTARMASVSSYDITQNGSGTKKMKDGEEDCEYLYSSDKLLNKELAGIKYASNSSLDEDAPPPPPRGSPNFLHMLESRETDPQDHDSISKMIDGLLDDQHRQKTEHQANIQKPKPEPISFSLPTADLEDDEVHVSFDNNGIIISKSKRKNSADNSITDNGMTSEIRHQSSRRCYSPETLIGQEDKQDHSDIAEKTEEELFTHPKCVTVNLIVEDPGDMQREDLQLNLAPSGDDNQIKDEPVVKFDEDKNVMIEITPREAKKQRPQSAKLSAYKGKPELRHVKSRTDSGIASNLTRTAKRPEFTAHVENHLKDTTQNQQNSEMAKSKLSFVTVNYLDDSDNEELPRRKQKTKKSTRPANDVETCMSRYCYSSDENSGAEDLQQNSDLDAADSDSCKVKKQPRSGKKIVSRPEANYYEMIRNSPYPGSDSETEQKGKKIKTVKTIELTNDGSVKETVFVSTLDAVEVKTPKTYIAPRPISAKKNRPTSAKKSDVNQPIISSGTQPQSVQQTTDGAGEPGEQTGANPARRQRVRSAPVNRKPDPLAEKIRAIHRNISENSKTKACMCKGLSHSHSKSAADMSKMASRDRSARRYYTGYPMSEGVKVELPHVEVPERVVEIWTRKEEFEIETDGLKECKQMHARLIEAGVPVTLDALKRGLLPPTEYGFAGPTYKSNVYPPEPHNYSDSLLSNPATSWLSDEHKRVMQLKKKVREATKALEQQRLEEAREALEAEARALKKSKRKSGKKSKKKRPKSAK